ncbi:MAG TPA: right-handed parallel beta-helix repeat-containing protein [Candidatus Saccharimonadales bacterium]|nr:right-handed parallel beta-helix repeat-containing protein [Candidatus Saccharimonadales bacterium]
MRTIVQNILSTKILVLFIALIGGLLLANVPAAIVGAVAYTSVDASAHSVAGAKAAPQTAWTAGGFLPCTKHVAPTGIYGGSTAGTGEPSNPYLSLKVAVESAEAGDTVCVRAGTYYENHIVPQKSGTPTDPIVVIAYPGPVTIAPNPNDPTGANLAVFDFNDNERPIGYWGIDSFTIEKSLNNVHYNGSPVVMQAHKSMTVVQQPGQPENAVHHITVQNIKMRNGKGAAGILLRGRVHDVLLRNITVENFHRWALHTNKNVVEYNSPPGTGTTYGRFDTHGIAIEGVEQAGQNRPDPSPQDPSPAATPASVERILIEKSTFLNNGGDGLQCLGAANNEAYASPADPKDIDIVDNKIVANASGTNATEEDGYDIKSCQNVSIRGTKKPLNPNIPENIAPNQSTMTGFHATYPANDWGGGNNSDGAAIVLHQYARNILIENNRIANSCYGIKAGLTTKKVQGLVIRGNLFTDLALFTMQPDQQNNNTPTANELAKCRGTGLQITNVGHADIYNNTFSNAPSTVIQLAAGYELDEDPNIPANIGKVPNNVDIWNNIMALKDNRSITYPQTVPGYWINMTRKDMQNIDSNYNLFWHPDNSENHMVRYPTRYTLSAWKTDATESRDTNSLRGAPLFKTGNPDYFTESNSPARDNGFNNLGYPTCGAPGKLDIGYVETCL